VGVVGALVVAGISIAIAGARPSIWTVAAGDFLLMLFIPVAAASSQAIFQSKVATNIQGRVFAVRSMIARVAAPLSQALAGPLADGVFEPLMGPEGALGAGALGRLIGSGPGRGIGLMFVLAGAILAVVSAVAWSNPRIRLVEDELPDAVSEERPPERR
jgi:hypothetical protein